MAVMLRLFKGMSNRIIVTVDQKEEEFTNSALVICNSKYTGGKMKIAPMARTDDGLLDVIVFNHVNRREILSIFSKIFSGTHISHPKVTTLRGKHIHIDATPQQLLMADGELLGFTPLKLTVSTKKLNLLI
jgi:diacylglycerol kinase family enzyme